MPIEVKNKDNKEEESSLDLFVDKNYEYTREKCDSCIVFIWVYGYHDDVQLSINIRSSASEIELKEMAVINDRVDKDAHRKYLINVEPDQVTMITFRIIEGFCLVEISDSSAVVFNETFNSTNNDYKDIVLGALQLPSEQ